MKRVAPIYADDSDWNLLLEGDREWASQSLNSVPALPLPQEVEILESNHPVADDGPDGGGVEFVDSVFHELVLPPISNFRTLSAPAPSLPRREEASTTNPAPAAAPPFLSSEHIDASPPVLQEKELDQISETSDTGTICCPVCRLVCLSKSKLTLHYRSHSGEQPFACPQCNRKFAAKSSMKRHLRTHTREKPFECTVCQKKFAEKGNLVSHSRLHTDEKPFKCEVCQKAFSARGNYAKHMRIHTHDKRFACTFPGCNKRFCENGNLVAHYRIHTKEKPYPCPFCDRRFTQKPHCTSHIQRSHSGS